ncbi:MAG: archease [Candidatus Woesearchaeota archaeon]
MKSKKGSYEFLSHTADIKFRAYGNDLNELFTNCLLAQAEVLINPSEVKEKEEKTIMKEAPKIEILLYDFLEEYIFLMDTENFILSRVNFVRIIEETDEQKENSKFRLEANILGDKAGNYDFSGDIKSITRHEMKIEKKRSGYTADIVVDV